MMPRGNALFETADIPKKLPRTFRGAQKEEAVPPREPTPEPPAPTEEPVADPVEVEVGEKPRKKRKDLTPERKKQLAEQLKKARVTSAANRTKKAKEKKLAELKRLEAEGSAPARAKHVPPAATNAKAPVRPAEPDLSEYEKQLQDKYENEYSHKIKDFEINHLKAQLAEKKAMATIKEVEEPKGKAPPVKDTISPCKNQRLLAKYRSLRSNRGY